MGDMANAEFATVMLVFRVTFGFIFALHGFGKV